MIYRVVIEEEDYKEEDDNQILSNEVGGSDMEAEEAKNVQEGGLEEAITVEGYQSINPKEPLGIPIHQVETNVEKTREKIESHAGLI